MLFNSAVLWHFKFVLVLSRMLQVLTYIMLKVSILQIQKSFQDLLRKQEGDRSVWEYPFAVAGVNITFMLIQMLDLEAGFPL